MKLTSVLLAVALVCGNNLALAQNDEVLQRGERMGRVLLTANVMPETVRLTTQTCASELLDLEPTANQAKLGI